VANFLNLPVKMKQWVQQSPNRKDQMTILGDKVAGGLGKPPTTEKRPRNLQRLWEPGTPNAMSSHSSGTQQSRVWPLQSQSRKLPGRMVLVHFAGLKPGNSQRCKLKTFPEQIPALRRSNQELQPNW
jgi:hypothetical protein